MIPIHTSTPAQVKKDRKSKNPFASNGNDENDIKRQSMNCSQTSSVSSKAESSLGILSVGNINLEDLSIGRLSAVPKILNDLDSTNSRKSSIDARLSMQRSLAEKVIERSLNQTKSRKPLTALPSRLLNVCNRSESTIENSSEESTLEFTKTLTDTKQNDRFSFNPNEISARSSIAAKSPNRDSSKVSDLQQGLRFSDNFSEEAFEQQKYLDDFDGSFVPAELAAERLLSDELSWQKDYGVLPPDKKTKDQQNASKVSTFSEFNTSKAVNDVSIGEFFAQKNSLANSILKKSPEKRSKPVPLIDDSRQSMTSTLSGYSSNNFEEPTDPRMSVDILSLSKIADLLRNNSCSPRTLIDKMLNGPRKSNANELTKTLKKDLQASYVDSIREMENSSSRRNSGETKQSRCSTISIAESENLSPNTLRNLDIINVDKHSKESFCEIDSEDWLKIESTPQIICTNNTADVKLSLVPLSSKWIVVKALFKELYLDDVLIDGSIVGKIDLKIPSTQILLKQNECETLNIQITSFFQKRIIIKLQFELTDMVSKKEKIIIHKLSLTSVDPKILIPMIDKKGIDFGLVGEECVNEYEFCIINQTGVSIPLEMRVMCFHHPYVLRLLSVDGKKMEKTTALCNISANGSIPVKIGITAPKLDDSVKDLNIVGKFILYTSPHNVELHEIRINAKIGKVKLHFKDISVPLNIQLGETKTFPIINVGDVPLDLKIYIQNNHCIPYDDFTVRPQKITLMPNQSCSVDVAFVSNNNDDFKREIIFEHSHGVVFKCPVIGQMPSLSGCQCRCSPKSSRSKSSQHSSLSPNSTSRSLGLESRPASRNSVCSSVTSELQDGKLPIDSTKTELVWGCIKLGKMSTLEFYLRNRSSSRIKFQAHITGSGFKIRKDQNQDVSNMIITLHSNESRNFTVIFAPVKLGAAIAKLSFHPYASESTKPLKDKMIMLYGYGGNVNIEKTGIFTDTANQLWFTLGRLGKTDKLQENFYLHNKGTLRAFVVMNCYFKGLIPFAHSKIIVTPSHALLEPGESLKVNIQCIAKKDEINAKIGQGKNVLQIAILNMITGPESTRFRIKRLFGTQDGKRVFHDESKFIQMLCDTFPNEKYPSDVLYFKEHLPALRDLLKELEMKEVNIILDKQDNSSTMAGSTMENTCVYQSLCSDKTLTMDITTRPVSGTIRVEPSVIMLILPTKLDDTLLLYSVHSRPVCYEIHVEPSNAVTVTPMYGELVAGESKKLVVMFDKSVSRLVPSAKIKIYVENEVLTVDVKIVCH